MGNVLHIRRVIADEVLKLLRVEKLPWRVDRGVPTNPLTGKKYTGINQLFLDAVAMQRGYQSKYWCTYHQWSVLQFKVAKRPPNVESWGVLIVNWQPFLKTVNKEETIAIERFDLMQAHSVFNAEQVFGRDLGKYLKTEKDYSNVDYSVAEQIIAASGAIIEEATKDEIQARYHFEPKHDCLYHRPLDRIFIPPREEFLDDTQYINTKFHELIHFVESRTGWCSTEDEGELIAEMATGFLESELGLPHDLDMTNMRMWLPIWIKNIEQNPKYLFDAAAQAHRSVDYLLALQPKKSVV